MPKPGISGYDNPFAKRLRAVMDGGYDKDKEYRKYTSIKHLADAIGLSRQSVSKYRDGAATPSIDNLIKISQNLNVSTDYLLGLSDYETLDKALESTGAAQIDSAYADLMTKIEYCDPPAKRHLLTLFENIITCYQRLGSNTKALQQMSAFVSALVSHVR